MEITDQTMQFLYAAALVLAIAFITLALSVTIIRLSNQDVD